MLNWSRCQPKFSKHISKRKDAPKPQLDNREATRWRTLSQTGKPPEKARGHQAPEKDNDLTAGGHELPRDWLLRIVLIWSGYAVSTFAGNAASYAGIWYATETTGSPSALALLYVLAFLPMGLLSPLGGAIAEVTGTPMFFTIDGAFMLALGAGIALSKSVRQLD